ncbi:hypothetical protein PM10SUCC1_29790 [Propionigenium maris DSM 9537]|uniref:Prepilin-type N-terminal cleavage/methylation domain-containing protein n=1 Tax=Propionigenium maris DSM 9537 TaxID=1123000 RepID=A0A9W6GNZ6_9FUSO|nr:hypothetical protein [Propionigenium maris]GLI57465.1 hypothetical protein PM10SUCC1_29790 [Propionigenium maris DSM 9537]
MKKRGVTYTEILVAITIFSLGIVPLMLSLNSSFEATVFNRDYTKALEYNAQLIEEISAMMPTKVGIDQYSSAGTSSSREVLYSEVKDMLEKRSENSTNTNSKKGIYHLVKWNDESQRFDFSQYNYQEDVDKSLYRIVEVGDLNGNPEDEVREFDVFIRCYNANDNEDFVEDKMVINLKEREASTPDGKDPSGGTDSGGSTGVDLSYEGASGGIDLAKGSRGTLVVTPKHSVKATSIEVQVEGLHPGSKPWNVSTIKYKINDRGSFVSMSRRGNTFIANVEVPVGAKIKFRLINTGNQKTKDIRLKYHLRNN